MTSLPPVQIEFAASLIVILGFGASRDNMGDLKSLLTALATVAVAAFSWGTWRLYQLERKRYESSQAEVYARAKRAAGEIGSAAQMLNLRLENEYLRSGQSEVVAGTIEEWKPRLQTIREEIRELSQANVQIPTKSRADLAAGEVALDQFLFKARGLVPYVKDDKKGTPNKRDKIRDLAERLRSLQEHLESSATEIARNIGGGPALDRYSTRIKNQVHKILG